MGTEQLRVARKSQRQEAVSGNSRESQSSVEQIALRRSKRSKVYVYIGLPFLGIDLMVYSFKVVIKLYTSLLPILVSSLLAPPEEHDVL